MSRIPIAEVTAIGFATSVFATIGAALFLGERFDARILAVLIGLLGALIIIRPGIMTIEVGMCVDAYRSIFLQYPILFQSINEEAEQLIGDTGATIMIPALARTELGKWLWTVDEGFSNFGSPMHGAGFAVAEVTSWNFATIWAALVRFFDFLRGGGGGGGGSCSDWINSDSRKHSLYCSSKEARTKIQS